MSTGWKRLVSHPGALTSVAMLSLVASVFPALTVLVIERATQRMLAEQPVGSLAGALALLTLVGAAVSLVRSYISRHLAASLTHVLRVDLVQGFHHHPTPPPSGERQGLLERCDDVGYGLSAGITALRAPLSLVFLAVAVGTSVGRPALGLTATLVPVAVLAAWGGRRVRRSTRTWATAREAWWSELVDQQNGLRTTQQLNAFELQLVRAAEVSGLEVEKRAELEWFRGVPGILQQASVGVLVAVWLSFGSWLGLAPQTLVAFVVALGLARTPLVRASEIVLLWNRYQGSMEALGPYLTWENSDRLEQPDFDIQAVCVPQRLNVPAFTIPAGQKVALVGASGSGKSTLLAVLGGRLPGAVGPDAVWLEQDPWIFNRSPRENLELGGEPSEASQAIWTELQTELSDRADRPAGDQGGRLSGGQRQRLALARALAGPSRCLLLDEATSELTPADARRVAHRLVDWERTVVMASHQPWFAERADRVLFLQDGAIAAVGTHQELLEISAYRSQWVVG